MASIGIAITTTPNRKCLPETIKYLKKLTAPAKLYIHNDTEFKGVAHSKNKCLYELRNCEHIFLLDDDCYPISDKWVDEIVTISERTGENHFLYCDERYHGKPEEMLGINVFPNCGGVFMYFNNKNGQIIKNVGYMNKNYKRWGFEHAGYSNRVFNAGLNSAPYISPTRIIHLLFSCDYDITNYPSSITPEQKAEHYSHNFKIFQSELNPENVYQPL